MQGAPNGQTLPAAGAGARAMRIGVVRNPRSHRNKGSALVAGAHDNIITAVPGSRDAMTDVLADFARAQVEVIVVDGGDGTVRDLLTRGLPVYGDDWPALMILPKGKTNALAVDLGMPGMFPLEAALARVAGARTVVRRPIVIEPSSGEQRPVVGFILGTGVFNAAIEMGQVAHRFGAFQGPAVAMTAALGVLQALFGIGDSPWRALSPHVIRPLPGGEDVPHSRHGAPGQRYATGFSTLETFPLGMHPFAGAQVAGPGGIRYLVIDAPLRRVIARVPAILKGAHPPSYPALGIHRGAADEIALSLGDRFILDGESFPPGDYRLRLGPELRFLVP